MDEVDRELRQIKDEIMQLTGVGLADLRRKQRLWPIVGEGDHSAELMMIGEAPGKDEVKVGRPFVGRSGMVLTQMLEGVGIKRQSVYLTSVVKDKPLDGRKPTDEEIEKYGSFTKRQIEVIRPKVIATLGGLALGWVWRVYGEGTLGTISSTHGKVYELGGAGWEVKLMPLFHPAVGLYDPGRMVVLKEDIEKLEALMKRV